MKLSKAQRELLEKAVTYGTVTAVDWHPPIKKLLALGLIEPAKEYNSWHNKWVATEAGRKALEKP